MNRSRGSLILIALLAAAIRIPSLLHDGIWRDEANVYVELTAPTFVGFLHRVAAIDFHPPLYFILVYAWVKLAGFSEAALKAIPFAFSVATVPLAYRLGKAADSAATGLIAAVLFAVAPVAVNYSTMYLYPLAIFSDGLLALAVTVSLRRPVSALQYLAVSGSSLLAVYSHYTSLILAALLGAWALFSPRGWKHGRIVASAILLGVLPFAFWLPVFLHQHHVGIPYQAPKPTSQIGNAVMLALEQLVPVPPSPVSIVLFASLLAPGVLIVLQQRSWRSPSLGLGVVSICAVVAVASTGLLVVRYVLPFCTLFYVFLGWLLALAAARVKSNEPLTWKRWGVPLVAALTVALLAANVSYALAEARTPLTGMRTFLSVVPVDPRTLYVIAPDYAAPEFAYYSRREDAQFIGFARIEHPEIYILDDYETIWADPSLVQKVVDEIAVRAPQFDYLDVVVDAGAHDQYRIPFGRVWDLVASLRQRYALVGQRDYPGRWEPVSVFTFRLRSD